jgi:hypothetical protein
MITISRVRSDRKDRKTVLIIALFTSQQDHPSLGKTE